MRVWSFLALVVVELAACSSFSEGGNDTPDAADADANASETAASDGTSPDAAVIDARLEGGCAGRWCDCVAPNAGFCDDFDKPNETVGQGWNDGDAGFYLDNGATMTLDTPASSPPHALTLHTPFDNTGRIQAGISEILGPLDKKVTIAFDVRLPNTLGNCASGHQELARIGSDFSTMQPPQLGASFGLSGGVPTLYLAAIGRPTVSLALAGIPTNTWVRVRFTVQTVLGDAGITLYASANYDDAGVADPVDAQAPPMAQLDAPSTFSFNWVSIGILDQLINSTTDCSAAIDNVAIYQ